MDKIKIDQVEHILKKFNETKDACSKLYRKLESANTKAECDELITLYKEIVNNLKIIKEQSKVLDDVDFSEDYLGTENEINDMREANCKNIQCLAQHLRGCLSSFQKFNEIMKNKEQQS